MISNDILQRLVFTFALFGVSGQFARCGYADLIVDIRNAQMQVGTQSFVDVYVSNSSGEINVGAFNLRFNIALPTATTDGTLEFQPTANQRSSERGVTDYIFFGTADASSFSSTRQDANSNRRQLVQVDQVENFIGFPSGSSVVLGQTEKLLARLEIQHDRNDATPSTFEVSLDRSSIFTVFNSGNQEVPIASESFATSESNAVDGTNFTNFGTITVNAVPEPSAGLLLALSGLGAVFIRRSRSCA